MPDRLTDAQIDKLLVWITSVSTKQTIIDAPSIRSLLEEVRERRKAAEYIDQHLNFHGQLADECDRAGTDFARGRSCGIMGLVEDIKAAIARAEKEGKNRC